MYANTIRVPLLISLHDAMVVINLQGRKSGSSTPPSVSDIVDMETDDIRVISVAEESGLGKRKQEALKRLVRSEVA